VQRGSPGRIGDGMTGASPEQTPLLPVAASRRKHPGAAVLPHELTALKAADR